MAGVANKKLIAGLAIWLAACLFPAVALAGDPDPHARFFEAGKLFQEGNYGGAARIYEALSQDPQAGPAVFYNLGNCYLRDNRLGPAILYYERARLLDPRNPDLDFNLRFARGRRQDQAGEAGQGTGLFSWLSYFTGSEVFWFFALVNVLFCMAIGARLWKKAEWTFYGLVGLALLWAMTGLFGAVKWQAGVRDARAVVVVPEAGVRAGPERKDTLLFHLHAGTVVESLAEEDGWRFVRFSDTMRGWVPSRAVMPVRPLERTLPGSADHKAGD